MEPGQSPNESVPVLDLEDVSHFYGSKAAIQNINISVSEGEIFGLLGPNGGGKTTLCRIISTTLKPRTGRVSFCGADIWGNIRELRKRLGVVFQASSLDSQLSVLENLRLQGRLHGLGGIELEDQIARLLIRFRLTDRRDDIVRHLSGGLRRRVEVAKAFIHQPNFLLLDEPSTGLDPGARVDLWDIVQRLRVEHGVTVFMTTHLIDEADRCDRVGIIHRGRIVAMGTPDELKAEVGVDVVTATTRNPEELAQNIATKYNVEVFVLDGKVRLGIDNGNEFAAMLSHDFADQVILVNVGKPTLEDVFIGRTGLRFGEEEPED
jgi:ABC-2 type transport system ATP-binding protein